MLSAKPIIYAANVADEDLATGNAMVEQVRTFAAAEGSKVVIVSAQVEAELVEGLGLVLGLGLTLTRNRTQTAGGGGALTLTLSLL